MMDNKKYADDIKKLDILQSNVNADPNNFALLMALRDGQFELNAKINEDQKNDRYKELYNKSTDGYYTYPLRACNNFLRKIDTLKKFHNWLAREQKKNRFVELVVCNAGVGAYKQLSKDIKIESYNKKQWYYFFFNYFLNERNSMLLGVEKNG